MLASSGSSAGVGNTAEISATSAAYAGLLGAGFRYVAAVEFGSGGLTSFYGNVTAGAAQGGLIGTFTY